MDQSTQNNATEILGLLTSNKKIDRDKGLTQLDAAIKDSEHSAEFVQLLKVKLMEIVQSDWTKDQWEPLLGAMIASEQLIKHNLLTNDDDWTNCLESSLMPSALDHEEVRVRTVAATLMGSLSRLRGLTFYERYKTTILEKIEENLERDATEPEISRRSSTTDSSEEIFHETAGWRHLETWILCLQSILDGCMTGQKDLDNFQLDDRLWRLLVSSSDHENRFVREISYSAIGSLTVILPSAEYDDQFVPVLAKGLCDNWSQVRMSASMAVRKFLESTEERRENDFCLRRLIPPICLNRYYVAAGVRLFNQETWRKLVGENGQQMVEKYLQEIVPFYIKQSTAENHAVREAACSCMAELANKIPAELVSPHANSLSNSLLTCFHDECWPVRDTACVVSGILVEHHHDVLPRSTVDQLVDLFFVNLADSISSVRQGAAGAIGLAYLSLEPAVQSKLVDRLEEALESAKNQPESSPRSPGQYSKATSQFGVARRITKEEDDAHAEKEMFSCGSLAPKMHRGGCSAGGRTTPGPAEPWQLADGGLFAVTEIFLKLHEQSMGPRPARPADMFGRKWTKDHPADGRIGPLAERLLPAMADVSRLRSFDDHLILVETVCRCLPVVAVALGRRGCRDYLPLFYDAVFYSLESGSPLTSTAGQDCLSSLAKLIGPTILRGRVEIFNPSYLAILDRSGPVF